MTIEKIIQKIKTETANEANKILKDAKLAAGELRSESNKELNIKLNMLHDHGDKRVTIMRNIHLSEARRMTRRSILDAKEELIQECFDQARQQLQSLSGDEYRKVFTRLIDRSLTLVGDNAVATLTRDADKSFMSAYPKIKVKPGITGGLGGLILESVDGKVVVNNTFDAILNRQMEEIRTEVANILYPE
jgi:vacuolar-type H+-ATPase subunit E/Vma4